MARARTLKLQTEVDVKGADKLKGLGNQLDTVSNKLLNPKALVGGFVGGIVASQAAEFLSNAINQAAEFNDSVQATGVIFGDQAIPAMEAWADKAAENFGASKREAIAAANQIAVMGKSAGLVGNDLVGFSQGLVGLGGDLASMFGGTTQDAITAVGAALRGESEPIRRYGVLLDDATLRQKALELGIVSTTKNALTPQQRVLAAQASIMEQTADAQGDFARTSEGMANTQRELAAKLDNVTTEIGERLLPAALGFANFIVDIGVPAIEFLIDSLGLVLAPVGFVIDAFGAVGDAVGDAVNFVSGGADDIEGSMVQVNNAVATNMGGTPMIVRDAADEMAAELGEAPGKMADELLKNQFKLTDATTELVNFMKEAITPAQEMMNLQGFLTSVELAEGLGSNNPLVRQKAEEMRDAALAKLNELQGLAQTAGAAVPGAFALGISQNQWKVQSAMAGMAQAAMRVMPQSEPKDPNSPFRGITTAWGFMDTLAKGLSSTSGVVGRTLAGSFSTPTLAGSFGAGGGIAPVATGGGVTINLTVNGDLTSDREAGIVASILRSWDVAGMPA